MNNKINVTVVIKRACKSIKIYTDVFVIKFLKLYKYTQSNIKNLEICF